MLSYLKGKVIDIIRSQNHRINLILEVNNMGYEMQITSKLARQLQETKNPELTQIFTHLQIKEDQQILYGFINSSERDLFRQLISVSGIGSQLGIALIDTLGLEDLVGAIVTGNVRVLSRTPGVGQKTAERIALELKTKLAQWRIEAGVKVSSNTATPKVEILEDLQMTLLALGYTNKEIEQAISVISQDNLLLKNQNVEEWIRSAIAYLSLEI
jgi:Holliday junction DNA helicase RuvA